MPQAGGIQVRFMQPPGAGTVFALYKEPPPGHVCDYMNGDAACQPEDVPGGALAFQGVAAGRYLLIVKAIGAQEAVVGLSVSAFGNRDVEICANGIDDDDDNLTDCDDPDCVGIGGCGAPACMPDQVLGALTIGGTLSASVDTRGAPDFYKTDCGKGDGAERVLRLTVKEFMQVAVDCMDGGSHVFELSRQLGPLDQCDADTRPQCADPTPLPFGCGYAMGGVQPGEYNFIVESFQKGKEGPVTFTLTGLRQTTAAEVCDNGFDDDKDGFVDCMDRKCVTDAACRRFACRADKDLQILPLDGRPVRVLVETSQAGDDQTQTPCVVASGGEDGVIDFEVPARANVRLDWAQAGSHAFALYTDLGSVYACEAGMRLGCIPSGGQVTGSAPLPTLPPGRYHLVVDADSAGSEGGVVIQLSGVPAP
jgi:hypothetical protein